MLANLEEKSMKQDLIAIEAEKIASEVRFPGFVSKSVNETDRRPEGHRQVVRADPRAALGPQ